ncbi:hypothetical protein B9Z55_009117 [Caenorhabditis nigoni]|uniref:RING-type domain-containing protein n=1 Tax=Caenorhabditis nigoni TaxID=1611254 RepID=A0A2G5UQW3_9PELO|nr:hypothetical protein B9Z55_009117 [Caenorhabditis nigoni]
MKLSGEDLSERVEELKPVLKSLTDFVKQRENKQTYIREVCISSEKPSEKRRVFAEEVLEIIPIILKQQNSRIEEWNDLLQKYQLEWMREHAPNSINMETFNSVLEEFNINKALITVVPDPIYKISEEDMLEFGTENAMRLSPDGTWLLDSSHAIFYIFQSVVWGVNWESGDECEDHENCKIGIKRMIVEVMRQYLHTPQGVLIPIPFVDNIIEWLRNQCVDTLGSKGICLDVDTSIAIDTRPHSQSLHYHVYQRAVSVYGLPNDDSDVYYPEGPSFDSQTDVIPVWMTRALLLIKWTQQFFDKETMDLANVILGLIYKKVPVESKEIFVFLLKTVQASIFGLNSRNTSNIRRQSSSTTNREEPALEAHQKMLRKAQERAEKLRKRKEQSKPNKVKKPSPTKVVRLTTETVEASFLDKLEYVEPKLKITKRDVNNCYSFEPVAPSVKCIPNYKEQEFGNVPNVFSITDNTGDDQSLETGALETSPIEEPNTKAEGVTTEDEQQNLKVDDDLNTINEFQKEGQDVLAVEKDKVLESEDVKALKKEVERLEEASKEQYKAFHERLDVINEDIKKKVLTSEKLAERTLKLKGLLKEKTNTVAQLEGKIRSLEVENERLKGFEREADKMKKEKKEISLKLKDVEKKRELDKKKMEEEKKKLKRSLDEKTRELDDVEKKTKLRDLEMSQMKLELKGLKKQSEDQEKLLNEKNTAIEQFKLEAEISKFSISEKDTEIVRLNNELSESTEANESLVTQISRLKDEMREKKMEEKEKNDSMQSQISTIHNLLHQLSISADIEDAHQFRFTLQRLRNIKDRFQNKDQLKLAKTMTDKLIQMSNRSEIRELALYEYQQYEANFQNYTQLVDLNIEKMKETRDCSLYSPLPKPPAFSDRFMNEYWLECDKEKKELEMDISDSECLICFFEINSDQKTLKCDHCNKITHLKCASKWLQIHRSCPHCRREQLDPEEFPALS